MATRSAEVKGYVFPETKTQATDVYARWGMSLSDAINAFLVKSIDVGGLPFDMRVEKPTYSQMAVLPVDERYGSSVLPAEMDDEEEEGLYDHLVR